MHVFNLTNVLTVTITKEVKVSNPWRVTEGPCQSSLKVQKHHQVLQPECQQTFHIGWETRNILEAYIKETKTKEKERGRWIEKFLLLPGGRPLLVKVQLVQRTCHHHGKNSATEVSRRLCLKMLAP